jgi:geranylgeranyl diphosphate synthase type II
MNIENYLSAKKRLVDGYLDKYLSAYEGPRKLLSAMRYSVRAGGKRLRPALLIAAAEACGGKASSVMAVACAVEFIHTFSLIHDDLPAVDDSPLRRGKPSLHMAFGESTAILAGDALSLLAFDVIIKYTDLKKIKAGDLLCILRELISDAGSMIGGEVLDIDFEKKSVGASAIRRMYLKKTAALIRASVVCGAVASHASPGRVKVLSKYGEHLGLAYQIVDDLLDVTATSASSGKPAGHDKRRGKATLVSALGVAGAGESASKEIELALSAIDGFGRSAEPLREMAGYILRRDK